MLRQIGYAVLFASTIFSTQVIAQNYELVPGPSMEFKLKPGEPTVLSNFLFWEVSANCVISSDDESTDIYVEALKKSGTVNGTKVHKGDTLTITVHDKEILVLSAQSGAKVSLTNQSENTIKALCTAQ